jgi:hypothetical protein
MLGVNDIVANVEVQRLRCHQLKPSHGNGRKIAGSARILPDRRGWYFRQCDNSLLITVGGCDGTRFDLWHIAAKAAEIHP